MWFCWNRLQRQSALENHRLRVEYETLKAEYAAMYNQIKSMVDNGSLDNGSRYEE